MEGIVYKAGMRKLWLGGYRQSQKLFFNLAC